MRGVGDERTNVRTNERTNERTNGWTDGWTRMSASKHSRTNRMARGFSGQLRGCSSSLVRHGPLTTPVVPCGSVWPPHLSVASPLNGRDKAAARAAAHFLIRPLARPPPHFSLPLGSTPRALLVCGTTHVCERRASYIEIAAGVLGCTSRLHFQVEVFPSPFCIPCTTKRYRYLSRAWNGEKRDNNNRRNDRTPSRG